MGCAARRVQRGSQLASCCSPAAEEEHETPPGPSSLLEAGTDGRTVQQRPAAGQEANERKKAEQKTARNMASTSSEDAARASKKMAEKARGRQEFKHNGKLII